MDSAPVSAILPTRQRLNVLPDTLERLHECDPAPDEIIVHVDAGDEETAPWLREHCPDVDVLESEERRGPGGGRNKLMEIASQPYVASFDDDSYPLDRDYFAQIVKAFERHPNAGVVAATIDYREDERSSSEPESTRVSSFVGCGCAYRRKAWQTIQGYVPLPLAYGMEEVDVSLQLLDEGWSIVHDRRLRVYHDTDRSHHESAEVTAAAIANRALLAYLRYPPQYWPLGLLKVVKRVVWSVRAYRFDGILEGLAQIPSLLRKHHGHRDPVAADTIRQFRSLQDAG